MRFPSSCHYIVQFLGPLLVQQSCNFPNVSIYIAFGTVLQAYLQLTTPAWSNSRLHPRLRWFVGWYNTDHRHSGIKFVSPAARHEGREVKILSKRVETYEQARRRQPSRWSRGTRNWSADGVVVLNPQRGTERVGVQESA
jgi:hypothetical protein